MLGSPKGICDLGVPGTDRWSRIGHSPAISKPKTIPLVVLRGCKMLRAHGWTNSLRLYHAFPSCVKWKKRFTRDRRRSRCQELAHAGHVSSLATKGRCAARPQTWDCREVVGIALGQRNAVNTCDRRKLTQLAGNPCQGDGFPALADLFHKEIECSTYPGSMWISCPSLTCGRPTRPDCALHCAR